MASGSDGPEGSKRLTRYEIKERLLALKSPETCAVFAGRCALRALPWVLWKHRRLVWREDGAKHLASLVAAIFCSQLGNRELAAAAVNAAGTARVAAADTYAAAAAARVAAADAYAASAATYATYAASAATYAASAAADAADAAADVYADALDADAADAYIAYYEVLDFDLNAAVQGPKVLLQQSLWVSPPVAWARDWGDLVRGLATLPYSPALLLEGMLRGAPDLQGMLDWVARWYETTQGKPLPVSDGDAGDPAIRGTASENKKETTQPAAAPPQTALASLAGVQVEGLATQDCLGRERLTDALRRLLTERAGTQHFALGLFGYWGTGKSSLIQQLRDQLTARHPNILVAEFNAWKHEKATNIGAMLAQTVVEGLTADLSYGGKLSLAVRLAAQRQSRLYKDLGKDGSRMLARLETWGWVALPPLLVLLAMGLLLWMLPPVNSPLAPWLAGVAGAGLAVAATYRSAAGFLKENLTEWFKWAGVEKPASLLQLPSYSEHRGLLGEIHRTLAQLCKAQLGDGASPGGKSLLLVVDDLDRCCVNTVKEVLDAVRLVADIPRVTTIVAIDERMAFAAVEKHYDQFGHAGRPPALVAREYLSKVLQASISLPEVGDKDIEQFVTQSLFPDVASRPEASHESGTPSGGMGPQPGPESAPGGLINDGLEAAPDKASRPSVAAADEGVAATLTSSMRETMAGEAPTEQPPSPKPLPEEVELFSKLAQAYRFGNPRLLGRLNLAWRLLKALRYGGESYRIEEVENGLRLLFWREFRLQQEAKTRDALDAWFAALGPGDAPAPEDVLKDLIPILDRLGPGLSQISADPQWAGAQALVDSVLLPASTRLPSTDKGLKSALEALVMKME